MKIKIYKIIPQFRNHWWISIGNINRKRELHSPDIAIKALKAIMKKGNFCPVHSCKAYLKTQNPCEYRIEAKNIYNLDEEYLAIFGKEGL